MHIIKRKQNYNCVLTYRESWKIMIKSLSVLWATSIVSKVHWRAKIVFIGSTTLLSLTTSLHTITFERYRTLITISPGMARWKNVVD